MSAKQSPTLPDFHDWVIHRLVEIVAPNPSAVTAWIIGQWIDQHEEWLEKRQASFKDYKHETGGLNTESKVLSMAAHSKEGGTERN